MADLFPAGDSTDVDQALEARLIAAAKQERPLRIKLGIDPTGSDIHLGHSILFRKLRAFQDAGHTAVLIIGDFTARIGDPTGKAPPGFSSPKSRWKPTPPRISSSWDRASPKRSHCWILRPRADWRCAATASGWRD